MHFDPLACPAGTPNSCNQSHVASLKDQLVYSFLKSAMKVLIIIVLRKHSVRKLLVFSTHYTVRVIIRYIDTHVSVKCV